MDQQMGKRNGSRKSRYGDAGINQLLAEYTDGAWTSYLHTGGGPMAVVSQAPGMPVRCARVVDASGGCRTGCPPVG